MELNAENMYLLALVETLKKENDTLKKEKVNLIQKLENAENSVSQLKAKLLEPIEAKLCEKVAIKKVNLKDQLEKLQTIADKLVKVSEQKCNDAETIKTNYGRMKKSLECQDTPFNKTSIEYPVKLKSVKDLETTFIEFRPLPPTIPATKLNNALVSLTGIEERWIPLETVHREPKRNNSNFSYEYLTELSQSIYPYHLVF